MLAKRTMSNAKLLDKHDALTNPLIDALKWYATGGHLEPKDVNISSQKAQDALEFYEEMVELYDLLHDSP